MSIIKKILCKHNWEFECNIPGPARMYNGWYCTQYICPKCGARKMYKEYIHQKLNWDDLNKYLDIISKYNKKIKYETI